MDDIEKLKIIKFVREKKKLQKQLREINEAKNNYITRQQFEYAADARDKERTFIVKNREYLTEEFDSLPESYKSCFK